MPKIYYSNKEGNFYEDANFSKEVHGRCVDAQKNWSSDDHGQKSKDTVSNVSIFLKVT